MIGQSVDACFPLRAHIDPYSRWRKIKGGPGGLDKLMAKIVPIEKAVHVGAQYAARFADGAVEQRLFQITAHDVGERARVNFVESFTDMDLITFEVSLRRRSSAEETAAQMATYAP